MSEASNPAAAIDPRALRDTLGCFPTGVTVVTAQLATGERAGLTVNSFTSVSLNPPLILWSLSVFSPNLRIFQLSEYFTINILAHDQAHLALQFSRPSPDKFEGVCLDRCDPPALKLAGTVAHLVCRNSFRHYGGDHVIFLGTVEQFSRNDDRPLVFCRGTFGSLPGRSV